MASLKKRGDSWSVQWWWDGKLKIKALGIKIQDRAQAERIRTKVEQALKKLRQGLFPKASKLLTEGCDITDVLFPHGPTAHLLDKEVAVEDDNPLTVSDLPPSTSSTCGRTRQTSMPDPSGHGSAIWLARQVRAVG